MSYNPTISLPTEQFYFFSPDSSTPWRTCCEDCHALHDILLLRTSAIRRRLYLGRRLDSHQDEFVLLATYRGGSLISFQDKKRMRFAHPCGAFCFMGNWAKFPMKKIKGSLLSCLKTSCPYQISFTFRLGLHMLSKFIQISLSQTSLFSQRFSNSFFSHSYSSAPSVWCSPR